MKLAVYGNRVGEDQLPYIKTLFTTLDEHQLSFSVYKPFLDKLTPHLDINVSSFSNKNELLLDDIDFLITLGGDGTILNATTVVTDTNIPILGINLGRLGFLASVEKTIIASAIGLEAAVTGSG